MRTARPGGAAVFKVPPSLWVPNEDELRCPLPAAARGRRSERVVPLNLTDWLVWSPMLVVGESHNREHLVGCRGQSFAGRPAEPGSLGLRDSRASAVEWTSSPAVVVEEVLAAVECTGVLALHEQF